MIFSYADPSSKIAAADDTPRSSPCLCRPCGTGTWLITEAEREGDDWRLFGYCHIYEWEWGYLMLSELASLRLPFGLTIERDIYTARKYVRDFLPQDE